MTPINALLIVLAYHSAAIAGLLVWRTRLRALPAFLAALSAHMALNLAERAGAPVYLVTSALGALYGPLVYVVVREAAFSDAQASWRDSWVLAPFAAALILPMAGAAQASVVLLASVAGLALAALTMRRFYLVASETRSKPDQARMDWLLWATAGFVVLIVFDLTRSLLMRLGVTLVSAEGAFAATLCGLLALTAWLAVGAVDHARRGGPLGAEEQAVRSPAPDRPDAQTLQACFSAIETVMADKQLFLEPGLKLAELADAAALTPREASQAINACFGANFSAYVNAYRARRARALIDAAPAGDRTFLDIAHEAGFSSKTTFNEFFRRETGQTPSAYLAGIRTQRDPDRPES